MDDVVALLDLPADIWTHILDGLVVHDVVMLQSTNKPLFKLCSERFDSIAPNDDTMLYFAEIGAISCLKYVRDIGIEWDEDTISAAAKQGQLETIKFLHQNGCEKDSSACELAALNGRLECLRYMHENGFPWNESATEAASKNLEILKYLHENGCPWNNGVFVQSARYSLDCLKYALDNIENDRLAMAMHRQLCSFASRGNLEALKYLHEAGFLIDRSCERAASVGSLECLKYAHENGDQWGRTILDAARGGHANCIKYALENGDSSLDEPDVWHIDAAVGSGNIESVKLLIEHGGKWKGSEYETAAKHNHLDMVKYLYEVLHRPKPKSNMACMEGSGNLSVLKYLHENGFSWDGHDSYWDGDSNAEVDPSRTIVYHAVEKQSLPCLKYIIECGYKLDTNDLSLCNTAAGKNDVEILKYLISLGCKRHHSIMEVAAKAGAVNVIKYLHKSGTDLSESVATSAAVYGHHNVLEYVFKHGYGLNSVVCDQAALAGHVKCLKVARKYGVPFTANTMREACESNHDRLKCMKYLHENGCEWTEECTQAASEPYFEFNF